MIKLIIFDIDGVITDGTLFVDDNGHEQKRMSFKDIDAIFEFQRKGFKVAAVTGEKDGLVPYFKSRFPWDYFYFNTKNKKNVLLELTEKLGVSIEEVCFVGEGKYDVEAIECAGLGVCPADAIDSAKKASDIILQKRGGNGCIWELTGILENYNSQELYYKYFYNRLNEHTNIFKKAASDQRFIQTVKDIGERMTELLKNGHQVFLCGNGGSAADAQHIAAEFVGRFYKERPAMNVEALGVNTSAMTAIANDYNYERIFIRQLEAKARPGDMLIGITTSGTSRNIIESLKYAGTAGLLTVMLTGDFDLPDAENVAGTIVRVPSRDTPRIQEVHIFIGHLLVEYVENKLFYNMNGEWGGGVNVS